MGWIAMTIPDDPAALPGWLESQLVGPDLGQLVAELRAVHGGGPPARPLDAVLGRHAPAVLASGLNVLSRDALRELLRNPDLLLDLQERVMVEGGAHWSELPVPEEFAADVDRGWRRLQATIGGPDPRPSPAPAPGGVRRRGSRARLVWATAGWATAAAVLVLAYGGFLGRPSERETARAAWGWQKPGAFPSGLSRAAYLNRLADEADEWFARRPTTPRELAARIGEFRQGCSALIRAEHAPLPEADRAWLRERCRAWSEKFDAQLAHLDETGDVGGTRAATDAVVRQLAGALRDRARSG